MPEIGSSGFMSGGGERSGAEWPKLPRPSSTLPRRTWRAPEQCLKRALSWRQLHRAGQIARAKSSSARSCMYLASKKERCAHVAQGFIAFFVFTFIRVPILDQSTRPEKERGRHAPARRGWFSAGSPRCPAAIGSHRPPG